MKPHRGESSASSQGIRGTDDSWLSHTTSWLAGQSELLEQIERVSAIQREAVAKSDLAGLSRALDERGVLVKRLEALHRANEAESAVWDREVARLSPEERALLCSRLEAVSGRVASIIAEGAIDQRALEHQREAITSELSRLDRGRGAIGAYADQSQGHRGEPKYKDEEA
jgi:hypothetical protein